jgi:hypothetical protein
MAKTLPKSHEEVDRLLAPSTREEQLSYLVRQTLSRQAQTEAKSLISNNTLKTNKTDKAVTPAADGLHHITLSNVYKSDKEVSFADELDAHIGRISEPSNVLSQRQIFEHSRERALDSLADSIFPGFGRLEFSFLQHPMRLDYLNARRCTSQKLQRLGICFSTTGH